MPATQRFPPRWPVRHGRVLLAFLRNAGTPEAPRMKMRVLIASGSPDAHNHYFYDLPARAIMLSYPGDGFNQNAANRIYDPAVQAQVAVVNAELEQVPAQ